MLGREYNEIMKATKITEAIAKIEIESLVLPSNITYGTEIARRGAVEIIGISDSEVEAWAGGLTGTVKEGGGSRRHVWLTLKDGKIAHHCSGNPKHHDIFCKHCVAVALVVGRTTT